MIPMIPGMKIFVAIQAIDFRKGIDGFAQVCREKFQQNPFEGSLFLFCNKKRTSLKILIYDGQGFWQCQKRLSRGKFLWWPKNIQEAIGLSVAELQILLWNGNPKDAKIQANWKEINPKF